MRGSVGKFGLNINYLGPTSFPSPGAPASPSNRVNVVLKCASGVTSLFEPLPHISILIFGRGEGEGESAHSQDKVFTCGVSFELEIADFSERGE